MFGDFLGSCENYCFSRQTGEATFGKNWATSYFNIGSHCSGVRQRSSQKNVQSLQLRRPSLRKDRERAFEIARKKLN